MKNSALQIVLLSGAVCSGKSALGKLLQERYGAKLIKTRDIILEARPRVQKNRQSLQRAGDALDREDGGKWVAAALSRFIDKFSDANFPAGLFVVDSVRIVEQVDQIRSAFGTDVHHIHVTAEIEELQRRYEERSRSSGEVMTYEQVKRNKTEQNVEGLATIADIVVATDRCSEEAVLVRATALLNLYPRSNTELVDVLIGGQYGSEGKGNIVGHIASEYDLLVRVGGPNAGHQVFALPQAEKYFHLPSGTGRAPNAQLLLGAGAVIYVPKLLEEIAAHQVDVARLSIDPQAMIIEEADRESEALALGSISSTAQGVGFASARKITERGVYQTNGSQIRLAKDIPQLRPFIREGQQLLEDHFVKGKRIMLEGTQGTLLSIHHGIYPFVTSRDTTVAGCLADAGIAPTNVRKVIMVCRTYPIRVGGPSGPMKMEIDYAKLARRSGIDEQELLQTEKTTTTNRQRRLAEFDWVMLKRAVQLNGPTDIALTFADYISIKNRKAYRVEQLTEETRRFIEEIERVSGRPVSMISTAFNWRNVIDRRNW
ncbi:adenylosuccinate synthetase [Methylocella sp. CPCC 101449]|uniref:adenylosuccinate synthetase n=1 Tax=Methylocella sp. CPCC 101449 TaxID=2987531 RepID=UPI00288F8C0C|nr:adenylosuccinate synthetase [Methylocella sp. CPCC 101449]MDT2023302.1 adenylosuccinate synthetase [Methylocella sp. CPCC 101449]